MEAVMKKPMEKVLELLMKPVSNQLKTVTVSGYNM